MCMGRTHVMLAGTIGFAIAAPLSVHVMGHPMSIGETFAFAATTAGYGILPDLDHPSGTLARLLGPITRSIAVVVHSISGGHRKGTHTIWMAGLMVGLVTLLAARFGNQAEIPIAFVGFYLTAMVLKLARHPTSGSAEITYLVEASAATAACYFLLDNWTWLPFGVGAGVIGHIIGDILTTEGVPILYPLFPRFVVKIPILGHTDGAREHVFAFLLMPVMAYVAAAVVTGNHWYAIDWVTHSDAWRLAASAGH